MPHADLEDVRLNYLLEGPRDKPVLAFSNSLGTNLHMWDGLVPAFTDEYRVLRYDTRGHGESSVPAGPYTIQLLAEDLLSLTEALGVQQFFFCGLSLGGMTGIWLGIHAPHRLQKLVLANTAARIGTQDGWNERIANVQRDGVASLADGVIERWFTPSFRQDFPTEVEAIRAMLASSAREGYVACCAAIRDIDMTTELHSIRTPSLILTGTHDVGTPPSDGRLLEKSIPGAQYRELAAAHLSCVERTNDFSAAVHSFLRTPKVPS